MVLVYHYTYFSLLPFDEFHNKKIRFKIEDAKRILIYAVDQENDYHILEIIIESQMKYHFDIYYIKEDINIKGKLELSDDLTILEKLEMDELINVMVDHSSLYLYGVQFKDKKYSKYNDLVKFDNVKFLNTSFRKIRYTDYF